MTIDQIAQTVFQTIHGRRADMTDARDQLRVYDLMVVLLALRSAGLVVVQREEEAKP